MGEITYIKDGLATTIHQDGSTSAKATGEVLCDGCSKYQFVEGGIAYREHGETVLWLCVYCKGGKS
jgi:hypothetical protein